MVVIDNLILNKQNKISIKTERHSKQYTIEGSKHANISIPISLSGYTVIGILGVESGAADAVITSFSYTNNATTIVLRNASTSGFSRSASVTVVYITEDSFDEKV